MFVKVIGEIDGDRQAVYLNGRRVAWLRDVILLRSF